jgi:hypothetical protein
MKDDLFKERVAELNTLALDFSLILLYLIYSSNSFELRLGLSI